MIYTLTIHYYIPQYCTMNYNNNGKFIYHTYDLTKLYKIKYIIYLDFLKCLSDSSYLCLCEENEYGNCNYCKQSLNKDYIKEHQKYKEAKKNNKSYRIKWLKEYWDFDNMNDYKFKSQFINYGGQCDYEYDIRISDIENGKFSHLCQKVIRENNKPVLSCKIKANNGEVNIMKEIIEYEINSKNYTIDYDIFIQYLEKYQIDSIEDIIEKNDVIV